MAKRKRVKFDWSRPSSAVVLGTLAAGVFMAAPAAAALPNCSATALAALNVPNLTITSATDVAATPPNPEYCLVVATLTTSGEGPASVPPACKCSYQRIGTASCSSTEWADWRGASTRRPTRSI